MNDIYSDRLILFNAALAERGYIQTNATTFQIFADDSSGVPEIDLDIFTMSAGGGVTATTGDVAIYTGLNSSNAVSGNTGAMSIQTGDRITGTGSSGNLVIDTGNAIGGTSVSGNINLTTGNVVSGSGAAGDIRLTTGN